MTQDREETIKKFVARVRGKAKICDLTTQSLKCKEDASYSYKAILAAVVRVLYDSNMIQK